VAPDSPAPGNGHSGDMSENLESTSTMSPPPGPPPAAPRPLHRSRSDRKVAGVCGGLAAYLGIDPIILRILVVVLSLFGGSGLLLYAAAWLLIPDEGEPRSELQKLLGRDGPSRPLTVAVAVLVVVALVVGAGSIFDGPRWLGSGPDIWPLLAIGGIGFAVWYSRRTPPGTSPVVPQPPSPAGTAWAPQPPYAAQGAQTPQAGAWATQADPAAVYQSGYATAAPPQPSPAAPKPRRPRSVLGVLTLSTAAIAAGIMLPFNRTGVWHLHAVGILAVVLLIVGLGLVVGAFVGRSRGLIVWGVLLSLATAVAAAVPAIDVHGTGNIDWRPTSVSALPPDGYRWGAGDTQLDLTALPPSTSAVDVRANLGAGTLVVLVPAGTVVVLDARVGLGTIRLPDGSHLDGVGRTLVRTIEPLGATPTGTMNVTVQLGAGTLEVRRAQA
jgi:phage shock protein PspC (stress-responsive transcriptional regulator)